jgi:DNA repair exonuclease SbcCD ATPase subunit
LISESTKNVQENQIKYIIRDHSRNGTFVNGKIVGSESREIKENDEISLQYKNIVKILYKFSSTEVQQQLPKPAIIDQPTMSSEPKNILPVSFEQQMKALKSESLKQEQRIDSQLSEIESLTKSLDQSNRRVRVLEKSVETLEQDLLEARDRLATCESNCSAVEARNSRLLESLDEARGEAKDLRAKVSSNQEEIRHKAMQLETRQNLIEEANRAFSEEKAVRMEAERQRGEVGEGLREAKAHIDRITSANQALQDIVSEMEGEAAALKERNKQLGGLLGGVRSLEGKVDEEKKVLDARVGSVLAMLVDALAAEKDFTVTRSAGCFSRLIGNCDQDQQEQEEEEEDDGDRQIADGTALETFQQPFPRSKTVAGIK